MTTKMVMALGITAGTAAGSTIYQLVRYGLAEVEWTRVLITALVTLLVLLLIPKEWWIVRRPQIEK
jgi:predicted MFS family arabinose efflux permease